MVNKCVTYNLGGLASETTMTELSDRDEKQRKKQMKNISCPDQFSLYQIKPTFASQHEMTENHVAFRSKSNKYLHSLLNCSRLTLG